MVISPETDIILLKTPFEIDNENNLTFSSKTAQYNYFNSLPKLRLDNATYQRKDNVVRYPGKFDDLIEYNYCMYRNENFSNKWFYAFIEDINFVNPNMTELKLKTDVWNTWQFDIVYKRTFVEREHVNDDTIGLHTISESVMTGEYISNKEEVDFTYSDNTYICFAITDPSIIQSGLEPDSRKYNGIFSGIQYVVVKTQEDAVNLIKIADSKGKADGIQHIFLLPEGEITPPSWYEYNYSTQSETIQLWYFWIQPLSTADHLQTKKVEIPEKIGNSYIPKNNKLFVFPYCCLMVTNNNGTSQEFRYEDFSDITDIKFSCYGAITPGGSIRLVPQNYKGSVENYSFSMIGAKLPICSWTSDVYTNWLTQNGVNIMGMTMNATEYRSSLGGLQTVAGAGQILAGDVSGASNLVNGSIGIFNALQDDYRHSLIPDIAKGNTNSGDVSYSLGKSDFTIYFLSIKDEYAKIIDEYFNFYGYKVDETKVPNITGRRNWNYVKTIGCNIYGDIPQKDLQEIKRLFNNGFTLWHNPSTFLDYSQDNSII